MWFVSHELSESEKKSLAETGINDSFLFPSPEKIKKKRQFWKIVVNSLHWLSVLILTAVLGINAYFITITFLKSGISCVALRGYCIIFCIIGITRELEVPCSVQHFKALGWPFSKFIFYTLIGFLTIENDIDQRSGWCFWLQLGALAAVDVCAVLFLIVFICCAHNARQAQEDGDNAALASVNEYGRTTLRNDRSHRSSQDYDSRHQGYGGVGSRSASIGSNITDSKDLSWVHEDMPADKQSGESGNVSDDDTPSWAKPHPTAYFIPGEGSYPFNGFL